MVRKWDFRILLLRISFLLVVYNEYLVYYINLWKWEANTGEGARILVVADPQILGKPSQWAKLEIAYRNNLFI